MKQTHAHESGCYRSGYSITELLLATGIIAILAALIGIAAGTARRSAGGSVCASNLKQLLAASVLYSGDHEGHLPLHNPRDGLIYGAQGRVTVSVDPLQPYGVSRKLYQCLLAPNDYEGSEVTSDYRFRFVMDFSQLNKNREAYMRVEPQPNSVIAWDWHHTQSPADIYGAGKWLVLYWNGSVKQIAPKAIRKSFWTGSEWTFDASGTTPNSYYEFVFPEEAWAPTLAPAQ